MFERGKFPEIKMMEHGRILAQVIELAFFSAIDIAKAMKDAFQVSIKPEIVGIQEISFEQEAARMNIHQLVERDMIVIAEQV
jgi:hypothetical protein